MKRGTQKLTKPIQLLSCKKDLGWKFVGSFNGYPFLGGSKKQMYGNLVDFLKIYRNLVDFLCNNIALFGLVLQRPLWNVVVFLFNQWGLGWFRLVWLMLVDGCAYLYEVLCDRDGITWAMDSKAQTAIANQPL